MLQDLERREDETETSSAIYQRVPDKRTRLLVSIILAMLTLAVAYFAFRNLDPAYIDQAMITVGLKEAPAEPVVTTQVSVNRALDKMMPRANTNTTASANESSDSTIAEASPQNVTEDSVTDVSTDDLPSTELLETVVQVAAATKSDKSNSDEAVESGVMSVTANNSQLQQQYSSPKSNSSNDSSMVNSESASNATTNTNDVQISRADSDNEQSAIDRLLLKASQAVTDDELQIAASALQTALDMDTQRHDIRKRLAVVLYSAGDTAQSEFILRQGIDFVPERADFRLMLGRMLHREQNFIAAAEVLNALRPTAQENLEYVALQAGTAQMLQDHQQASVFYSQLASAEPTQARWWLGLAVAKDTLSETSAALRAYKEVQSLQQLPPKVIEFVNQRVKTLGG